MKQEEIHRVLIIDAGRVQVGVVIPPDFAARATENYPTPKMAAPRLRISEIRDILG